MPVLIKDERRGIERKFNSRFSNLLKLIEGRELKRREALRMFLVEGLGLNLTPNTQQLAVKWRLSERLMVLKKY